VGVGIAKGHQAQRIGAQAGRGTVARLGYGWRAGASRQ
jgi:hypothetical protein